VTHNRPGWCRLSGVGAGLIPAGGFLVLSDSITGAITMQDDDRQTTEYILDIKDPWQGICMFLTGVCCGIIVTILFQHFAN
jgi:hypothetical protein